MQRWLIGPLAILLLGAGCLQSPAEGPTHEPRQAGTESSSAPPSEPALTAPVRVSPVSSGAEPVILADRAGKLLWIGDTDGIHYSTNNGATWQDASGYTGNTEAAFGDGVALAQTEKGRVFAATLHDNRADVSRSDDGKAFSQVSYVAGVPVDRPWIAAHGDTVAMIYLNNLGAVGLQEACSRSTDAGATFLDRSPSAGPSGSGGIVMFADGSFYFTTPSGSIVRHATCTDSADERAVLGNLGVNNFIPIATDGTALFVAGAGSNNEMKVAGVPKWGGRPHVITVSPPELATNTYAAVAAQGGSVAVAWYGSTSKGDPSANGFSGSFNVYLALVTGMFGADGGPTVQTWKVTSSPNHRGTICMGGVTCTGNRGLLDYFGVTFDQAGDLHVAYVDDTGSVGVYHARVTPGQNGTIPQSGGPGPTGPEPSGPGWGPGPVARFKAAQSGFTVEADSSGSTGDPPLSFVWQWGDGSEGAGSQANHTYDAGGTYVVRVEVTDGHGRVAAAQAPVNVSAGKDGQVDAGARGGHSPAPGGAVAVLVVAAVAFLARRRDSSSR